MTNLISLIVHNSTRIQVNLKIENAMPVLEDFKSRTTHISKSFKTLPRLKKTNINSRTPITKDEWPFRLKKIRIKFIEGSHLIIWTFWRKLKSKFRMFTPYMEHYFLKAILNLFTKKNTILKVVHYSVKVGQFRLRMEDIFQRT